jgi:hypothetical protein
MSRHIVGLARTSLSLLALLSISPAALADVTIERTTTVEPLSPPSSVTTIKQVVTPDVESSRLLLVPTGPISSSSSVTTITETARLGKENFARRLSLMKDQLDNGISRGWINSDDAIALSAEYGSLLGQLDQLSAQGYSSEAGNSLERQLNKFNIDLSQRMSTASAGLIQ